MGGCGDDKGGNVDGWEGPKLNMSLVSFNFNLSAAMSYSHFFFLVEIRIAY